MELGKYADGRSLTYGSGAFAVGEAPVTTEQVRSYAAAGQITWAGPEMATWFDTAFPVKPEAVAPVAVTPEAAPQASTAKKKPSKAVIGIIAGVLVFGCAVCGVAAALTPNKQMTAVTTSGIEPQTSEPPVQPPETAAPAPEPVPAPEPAPAPAVVAPAAPKWTQVAKMSGSASKRGASFHLDGSDARMTYKVTGGDPIVCGFYVVEKGKSIQKDGGFPETMISEAGKDTTMLSKGAGDYYLDVTSANCKWTVTIEELR